MLILPVAFVICLFSSEILNIWTSDPTIVRETHIILSLLIIGTTLNGLMNLPYAMQLAYGITNLGLYTNLISLVLLIPLIVYMAVNFGAVGSFCLDSSQLWVFHDQHTNYASIHFERSSMAVVLC